MKHKSQLSWLTALTASVILIVAACGQATPNSAPTEAVSPANPTAAVAPTEPPVAAPQLVGDSLRGGVLYDKWWPVLGLDAPEGDQPLWATQTTNTRTGTDTWRCKECHGWDYKGVDGAYGSGSHKTGFVGVMGMSGQEANEILAALKGATNPDHDFSTVMDDQALTDIALFLSGELADYSAFVNADKSLVGGDAEAGKAIFDDNCTDCHGPQGLAINFADETGPEYYATIATDNPWEFLHKARFGQPGVDKMPSLVDAGITDEELANLLAYAYSLPTSSLVTEGGVLYDNWMKALGQEAPADNQPLWATQTTNTRTGADTWRCKECHGWDYKGVDGRYGSGSHATGFKGTSDSASLSLEEIVAWLNGTQNPDHDFSAYMEEAQFQMLAAFIQQGQVDTTPFINDDKTVNGDAAKGKAAFDAVCTRCHGEDGKTLNFGDDAAPEFVGTLAADNPWEFFHKVANSQPGETMPSGINLGWTLEDIADLLAYAQTLPQ